MNEAQQAESDKKSIVNFDSQANKSKDKKPRKRPGDAFSYENYRIDPERMKNFYIAVLGIHEANKVRWAKEEEELKKMKKLIKSKCSLVPGNGGPGQQPDGLANAGQ